MQHLDEGTIHAWLDGELPSAEREAAEAHIAQCEQCAAAVAEARGFIAASSRILMALDAVPGGVLPAAKGSSAPAGKRTPARFTVSRAWMAAAAVLILSTATAIAVRPRSDNGVATLAQRDEMRAPHVDTPVSTSASAPAIAPDEKKSANAVASNAPAPTAAARGVAAPNAPASNALAPKRAALAVVAKEADSSTLSDRKPSALALLPVAPAGRAADAMVAKAESPAAPAAVRMEAQSRAAGASGTIGARQRLPESLISSEQNAPQVVSRSTTTENGDTVVTTVYSVNGVPVSLIDESTSRNERQPEATVSVADQPMAKARDSASATRSITWSDSTGHTRTLRGAMSQTELERVKRALFGPTP
jgi:Putative zinc-finger